MKQTLRCSVVVVVLMIPGCTKKEISIIGNYRTYKPDFLDKAYRSAIYDSWVVGTTMKSNSDSTYELKNCSMLINGKWTQSNDSVFLTVAHKKWRIDSWNQSQKWKRFLKPEKKRTIFTIAVAIFNHLPRFVWQKKLA